MSNVWTPDPVVNDSDPSTDAGSSENVIINGDCVIAQAGNSFAGLTGSSAVTYPVDGQRIDAIPASITGVFTAKQTADHPILGTAGKCTELVVTTADATVGADNLITLSIPIEGLELAKVFRDDAAAQFNALAIGFWIKAAVAGIYAVTFNNHNNSNLFPSSFTVNKTGVWEFKLVAIDAAQFTAGLFTNLGTTSQAAGVSFILMAGSNFNAGVANEWTTVGVTNVVVPNTLNLLAAVNNYIRVTDLQLYRGTAARAFPRRSFAQNLQDCLRQYWQTFAYGTIPVQNVGSVTGALDYVSLIAAATKHRVSGLHPVEMRIAPTTTYYNPLAANSNWRNNTAGADSGASSSSSGASAKRYSVANAQVGGDAVGQDMFVHASFNARM